MDLKMPEMNGWEATRIIKSMRPDLPVIAQTAHALAIETSQLNTKGFDDFVTKPIKKSELFEKIFRYMNQL
jgi:CheY-like chemotaxis protein